MPQEYKNIKDIIQHSIRKHEGEFVIKVNHICRNCDPHDGSGWSFQLPNYLRDSYTLSLESLLNNIEDVVIAGYKKSDVQNIKNLITHKYIESIHKSLEISSFKAILNKHSNSYALMISNRLEEDVESILLNRTALWKEKIKIKWDKMIFDWVKKIPNAVVRLFKII